MCQTRQRCSLMQSGFLKRNGLVPWRLPTANHATTVAASLTGYNTEFNYCCNLQRHCSCSCQLPVSLSLQPHEDTDEGNDNDDDDERLQLDSRLSLHANRKILRHGWSRRNETVKKMAKGPIKLENWKNVVQIL